MAELAIKGYKTRGKEVIEILEMLGGENKYDIVTLEENLLYTIREGDNAIIATYPNSSIGSIFTLEEFLKKFPYKVGDKVLSPAKCEYKVSEMKWNGTEIVYALTDGNSNVCWFAAKELEIYKETKTIPPYMDYDVKTSNEESMKVNNGTLVEIDLTRELKIADKVEIILGDYEVKEEDGKTYLVKKKPKYPKTYVECAKLLGCFSAVYIDGYKGNLLDKLQELLVCRDAYWKIAGEQLGLKKHWEPDWCNNSQVKYSIITQEDKIIHRSELFIRNALLSFPATEMRDAFYENFKELIEKCKELL